MHEQVLAPSNRERTIDALARNNNIIKSLFHYDKQITFLIVSLAFQKIKSDAHKDGLVVITRPEINSLASGKNSIIGINKLIALIRADLELHNFFNLYSPNSGLTDIRQSLVKKTAITKDSFNDLIIQFDESLFMTIKGKSNYTTQSLNQLKACNENQTTILYTLTQPYSEATSPDLKLNILQLRLYLRIADDAYVMPKTLTMRVKKICEQVTKKTDITLSVITIKKNGDTGVTIGYSFHSKLKKQPSNIQKIETQEAAETHKSISIRQQLINWGVGKDQIERWLKNINKKTLNNAIKLTLERKVNPNKNVNAGGFIYAILGDGRQSQLATAQIKNAEVVDCLKKFGLKPAGIKNAQNKVSENVLTAITNKCLRSQVSDENGTENMKQFFNDQLEITCNDLRVET